ncbi:MAG TPA: beta-ketoacyl-[acyl-carrier-protein] synthase II, partial [Chitinophagales bacterium]|nr:beta-ketoacyl-[acyl-carrier-protein] synthase II [Chitinophagales bacterium]
STPLGDVAELQAIEHVFGSHISSLQVSSTKSMTGHLLGAAGITEAITAVLAIQEQKVPPTINLNEQDESINPAFKLTPNIAVNQKISAVLSNNFGFGGHNASLVLRKYIDI